MVDYYDEAMPVFKWQDPDPYQSAPKSLSVEQPATQPRYMSEFAGLSDEDFIDKYLDAFENEYEFSVGYERAKQYTDRYNQQLKEYEEQGTWRKILANTKSLQTAVSGVFAAADRRPERIATGVIEDYTGHDLQPPGMFETIARGIDNVVDRLVETDEWSDLSDAEKTAKQKAMFSGGAAFIAGMHEKLGVKQKPGASFDLDIALDEGMKSFVKNMEMSKQAIHDFLFQEAKVEGADKYGLKQFVSEAALKNIETSNSYLAAFLEPTTPVQDRLALIDGWQKHLNNFVMMGPQMAAQVGATMMSGGLGGMVMMAPQLFGAKYDTARKNGASVNTAIGAAALDTSLQLPFEMLGMYGVLKGVPSSVIKNPIAKFFLDRIVGFTQEGITEYLQAFPDQFTEAIADPDWVKAYQAADSAGKTKMIKDRFMKAATEGIDELIVGGLWGAVLGGGASNMEIVSRYNKYLDKAARDEGSDISVDVFEKAKKKAKDVPDVVKTKMEASDVLNAAIKDVQDDVAIAEKQAADEQAAAMPVTREIEQPPMAEDEVVPGEVAPEAEAVALPPEIEALKETDPDAYQLFIEAQEIQEAEKTKEPTTEKAKKASVKMMITKADKSKLSDLGYSESDINKMKPQEAADIIEGGKKKARKVGLSFEERIEKVWSGLTSSQKNKVKDLYENVIEPMPAAERYAMMQADLAGEVDFKQLERPTLEEWRSTPELRTPGVRKAQGRKVYMKSPTGRKARQINRTIDIAYAIEYGEEAYKAEKAKIEQKMVEKPTEAKKPEKAQETQMAKPQPIKKGASEEVFSDFIEGQTALQEKEFSPESVTHVTKLNKVQAAFKKIIEAMTGRPVAFFKTSDPALEVTAAARVDAGMIFNVDMPEGWLLPLFGHESWHDIQELYPELAEAVRKVFWDNVNRKEYLRYAWTIRKARQKQIDLAGGKGKQYNEKQIRKEFEADYVGSKFADPKFLKKLVEALAKKDANLLAKLIQVMNTILRKIQGVLNIERAGALFEEFAYVRSNYEQIEDVLIQAYTKLAEAKRQHPMASPSAGAALSIIYSDKEAGPEKVAEAAYRHDETGEIFTGINHGEAYEKFLEKYPEAIFGDGIDGFTTTRGRFVEREEALQIANKNEQLRKEALDNTNYLISEDLTPQDVEKLYSIKDGEINFKGDPSLDVKMVAIVSALNNGGDYIAYDPYLADSEILKSIGFEVDGDKLVYKGEVYEPSIIIGRYEAAWNKTIEPDGTAGKLYNAVRHSYEAGKRGELDYRKPRDSEKKLEAYLGRSQRSYREGEESTKTEGPQRPTKNIRVKSGKSKEALIQISSLRAREEATAQGDSYFDKLYSLRDGYVRPTDFWELPTWMAHASNTFKNADVYVVRNINEAIEWLKRSGYESIMFSSMDANRHFIRQIAKNFDGEVVIGGYADPKYFDGLSNVKIVKNLEEAAKIRGVKYRPGVDYRLFKGTRTIPRLELSQGCKYKCAFCTVPKKVVAQPLKDVLAQADAFKGLDYKLIYLNDKTFGQAKNYKDLVKVNTKIRKQNPNFQGFIIQTTAPDFLKLDDDFIKDSGIKFVELGLESFNDDILANVNKPHRTKHIADAVEKIRKLGIKFIPNTMVGLAGMKGGKLWTETDQTYENTVSFLRRNMDVISHVNTYVLATYEGTKTGEQLGTDNEADNDENVISKSWLKNRALHEDAYRRMLNLGTQALEGKLSQSLVLPETGLNLKRVHPGRYSSKIGNVEISIYQAESKKYWSSTVEIGRYGDDDYQEEIIQGRTKEDVVSSIRQFLKNKIDDGVPAQSEETAMQDIRDGLLQAITFSKEQIAWAKDSVTNDIMTEEPRIFFHATTAPLNAGGGTFDIFNVDDAELGTHFGTAEAADMMIGQLNFSEDIKRQLDDQTFDYKSGRDLASARVYPVILNIKNPLRLRDGGRFYYNDILEQLRNHPELQDEEAKNVLKDMIQAARDAGMDGLKLNRIMKDHLKMLGYDGIIYLNRYETPLVNRYLIEEMYQHTDEEFIDAVYDPEQKYSYEDVFDMYDSFIIFDANQVKSVFNQKPTEADSITQALALKDFGFYRDNPGGEWLEHERSKAKAGRWSAVTGGFHGFLSIPTRLTKDLPGEMGEHDPASEAYRDINDDDVQRLMADIKENGILSPIFITVEWDGSAKINEGNRRALIARHLGLETIPAEIRYFAGGEEQAGPFNPEDLIKVSKPWTKPKAPDENVQEPQIEQAISMRDLLAGEDIKITIAGKDYVINEQRESIEALVSLNGGTNGLERLLRENGVDKLRRKRIVTIARNMVKYPFPSVEQTANDLIAYYKKNPEVRDWYDDIKYLRQIFKNENDLGLFLGFAMLAHTSRNTGTLGNMLNYFKFRTFQKAGQIDTTQGFGLVEQQTIERVMNAKNIEEMFNIKYNIRTRIKEGELKVKAFADTFVTILNNPNGRAALESVNDIWVNRYFFPSQIEDDIYYGEDSTRPHQPPALSGVQHLRIQRHMREVEKIMAEKTGMEWNPDQAQAVLWFFIRDKWEQSRGKAGQEGYTFDETLAILAARWAGVAEATPTQVEAFIKLKFRDPTVRLVLDLYSEEKELDIMDLGKEPTLLKFYDAGSMPKDIDPSGKTRYRTVIETDRVYDADVDSDNLIDAKFDLRDTTGVLNFEKRLKDSGYVGLRSGNVTILFEPTRIQPMKRGVLSVSSVVSPEVMKIIKKSFPAQHKKLLEYEKLYGQGKDEEVFEMVRDELEDIFAHPLTDIRYMAPAEGRWEFDKEASFDVSIEFADNKVAIGLLAQFLKNNAQYEGVLSEQFGGWNEYNRPKGIPSDQAPSVLIKFKEKLTDKEVDKIAAILVNNGIPGSTYSSSINALTLHHFRYRHKTKTVAKAVNYNGVIHQLDSKSDWPAIYKKIGKPWNDIRKGGGVKGFVTNQGDFVDERAAKEIQEKHGKLLVSETQFLENVINASKDIADVVKSKYSGLGTVWYKHEIISNDWTKNKEGEEYDKKIEKARTVSRDLGIIAEPTIIAGRERVSPEILKGQPRSREGEVHRLNPKVKAKISDFVSKKPWKADKRGISEYTAKQFEYWKSQGINIGPEREKALNDFYKGKRKAVQEGLFQSIDYGLTEEQAKAKGEAYQNAPDNLLGFSKDPFIQKGFYDQNYSYTARVQITYPKTNDFIPGQTFVDEIRGLNRLHAVARARRNWSGANVKFLDGYKNNERTYKSPIDQSIMVYHGTGAEYAQYDTSFMKTGEGFLAFGWGIYFTEVRGIAEDYARKLAKAGRLETLKLSLPIDDGRRLKDYTVYETGMWNMGSFAKTVMDAKGEVKDHILGGSSVDTSMWARNEVARYIRKNIDSILSNLENVTEGDVRLAIKDILYDLVGHMEFVQLRIRQEGTPATYVPEWGMMTERLAHWIEQEVYEWERAMDDRLMHTLTVAGGKKIVHKTFLDDSLKFIDWYQAVPRGDQEKIVAAAKKAYGDILGADMEAAWDAFEDRILNNPSLPRLKDIYHEMVTLFGYKRIASEVLESAGWDGIRYPADSLYGNKPESVEKRWNDLQNWLHQIESTLPPKLRDVYNTMDRITSNDPVYIKAMKDHVESLKETASPAFAESFLRVMDEAINAYEKHWKKNYVVFKKVEDKQFVSIKEKIYLSLAMFNVQEKGAKDWINSKIGDTELSFHERLMRSIGYFTGDKENKGNWRYLVFDKLDPIKQWLGGEHGHAYMKARGVPGSISSLAAFLESGKLEWDSTMTLRVKEGEVKERGGIIGKLRGPEKSGFIPWLKSLGPNDGVKFFYWLIAKRAEALDLEGREYWLKEPDRKKLLAWVGVPENKEGKTWEQINEEFQAFNKNILDIATKAGVINPASRASWESEIYIPFYRIIEDPIVNAEFWRGPMKGRTFLSNQIRRLQGAEAKIGDPYENIMRNWTNLLTTSITNVARASAVKYAADNQIGSGFTREVKKNTWTVYIENPGPVPGWGRGIYQIGNFETKEEAQEFKLKNSNYGMVIGNRNIKIKKEKKTVEEEIPLLEPVSYADTVVHKPQKDAEGKKTGVVYVHKKTGEGLLSYLVGGKQYYFKVNNPELYIAISGANPHQFNNAVMEIFRTTKKWLTYGATFGPGFRIANLIRDTLHSAVVSKSFMPFWDTAKGFVHAWRQDEAYVQYIASGHAFGGHYVKSDDPKALAKYLKEKIGAGGPAQRFINKLMGKDGQDIVGRILDTPFKMLEFWEKVGAASENAARIQLAENMIAKGESTAKAYFSARDLMDFQMSGAAGIVQGLIQVIPFLNARAQGLYKMGRSARENPQAFITKGLLISLASLGLWLMYRDDDRYKELEDWEKFAYYHFWIGDYHYRIPKPFETGVIFSTSVEAAGNVMVGNEDWTHIFTYLKHAITETFAFNPILGIQAIKPLAEQWANKVSYTGRPIEGQGMSGLRWQERYDPWTSETMRAVGAALNLPPKRMEHLIRGYFGTFGMFLLGLSDMFTRNVLDFPERPKKYWNEYPGVDRFIKQGPARNTKYMSRFYELSDEFSKLTSTVNYYKRLGDLRKANELIKDEKAYNKLKKLVSKRQRDLSDINRNIRLVWLNKNMDGAEKKKRLEALTETRNQIVRDIYNLYKKES